MASSSKVKFNLDTLREQALKSIDSRIETTQLEVDSFGDDQAFATSINEWRNRQEKRISDLFRDLGEDGVDNLTLSSWKMEPIPVRDQYAHREAKRNLDRLVATRSQVIAKSESLVPGEDGHISLTKTQLSEFFGL